MNSFMDYARYYDMLYTDKDYAREAEYIHDLIKRHNPDVHTILELGCGTGRHALLLASYGYTVHGIDNSQEMINAAVHSPKSNSSETTGRLTFEHADIRSFRCNKVFDTVISLFHVISYQTSNQDLLDTIATARQHLKSGGTFIFDCWYGPAVLSIKPETRVKRLENAEFAITRIAESCVRCNDNAVDVNYDVFVKEKSSGETSEIKEVHQLRYLFKPEVDILMAMNGMEVVEYGEWMTGKPAGSTTWGVYFVARPSLPSAV